MILGTAGQGCEHSDSSERGRRRRRLQQNVKQALENNPLTRQYVLSIFAPQLLILSVDLISISVLPSLLQDITDRADKWGDHGKTGRIDPFTEVYDVSLSPETYLVLGLGLNFPLSAHFRHDSPDDRLSRLGKERSRSQEDQRTDHDLPGQRYPRLLATTLVPESVEEGKEMGYH